MGHLAIIVDHMKTLNLTISSLSQRAEKATQQTYKYYVDHAIEAKEIDTIINAEIRIHAYQSRMTTDPKIFLPSANVLL
jgi:hypothetical protein